MNMRIDIKRGCWVSVCSINSLLFVFDFECSDAYNAIVDFVWNLVIWKFPAKRWAHWMSKILSTNAISLYCLYPNLFLAAYNYPFVNRLNETKILLFDTSLVCRHSRIFRISSIWRENNYDSYCMDMDYWWKC